MGHTLAEKILAAKCGREQVFPGEFINARVDLRPAALGRQNLLS